MSSLRIAIMLLLALHALQICARAQLAQIDLQGRASKSLVRYLDPANGMTADQAVAYALAHNGELLAARSEIEAARAMVRQASLRSNPSVDFERKEQIGGRR